MPVRCTCGRRVPPGLKRSPAFAPPPRHAPDWTGTVVQIEASSTFEADAERRFDLSYADGSELKGFNAHDVVHVSAAPPQYP
jgi:hypothetical protein